MKKKMSRLVALTMSVATACVPTMVQAQTMALQQGLQQLYSQADSHNALLTSLKAAVQTAEAGIEMARMSKLPDIEGQA